MRDHLLKTLAMATALVALGADDPNIDDMRSKLLYPVARVSTGSGSGSGTVVYSDDRGGQQRTFVLTNHHVVDAAIKVVKEWDNLQGREVSREKNEPVDVEIFAWSGGTIVDRRVVKADVYAHSEAHDLAVLELKANETAYPVKLANVAELVGEEAGREVGVFTAVVTVGCGLGLDPTHSRGDITDAEEMIDGKAYAQSSAPIIFGNSGGAVFARAGGEWKLVGVPARIAVSHGSGVTHLNFFVPHGRVRQFFGEQKLAFLLDPQGTPAQADAARAAARTPAPGK